MAKWKCSICGYIHDEETSGAFAELENGWVCPLCKAEKSAFAVDGEISKKEVEVNIPLEDRELSNLEVSVICSNLARGCEKQYLAEEAEAFSLLASYYESRAEKVEKASMHDLLLKIQHDLDVLFPQANQVAEKAGDRGALRALTWSVKVSTLLKSLLERYENQEDTLQETGVFVCTICGFIYVGNDLPQLCPVCKVPNYKFEEIKGGQNNG